MTTRILAVMGSGETAPTMIKPHRSLFERLGPDPVPAVLLDTPYGFQSNASDISARAVEYFSASVGRPVEVAGLRSASQSAVELERALARVAAARWVFSGPGSPTYALRQWRRTDLPDLLRDKLAHGGCVAFSSAAALTLGRYTVPVYEVYKVGAEPSWEEGLGLADFLGPEVAVIPHYDNAEGGNHDTRFCYLGESRLAMLEEQMGDEGWVLGIDEHTGCFFDLEAGTATVVGNGGVTVRRQGRSSVVATGTTLTIDELVGLASGGSQRVASVPPVAAAAEAPAAVGAGDVISPLHAEIRRIESEFDSAVDERDAERAAALILELDDTMAAWAADTLTSDAPERARAAMRRMIVRLGSLAAEGGRDPRAVVEPFVSALLAERAAARTDRRFADADRVRDALVAAGVEVRDTPDGTVWDLTG